MAIDTEHASTRAIFRGVIVTKTSSPTEQHQLLLAAIGAPLPVRHTAMWYKP